MEAPSPSENQTLNAALAYIKSGLSVLPTGKDKLDTYAHWMPGGKKAAVDELDAQQAPGNDEPA